MSFFLSHRQPYTHTCTHTHCYRWWPLPPQAGRGPGGCVSSSCGSGPAAGWSSTCGGRCHELPQQGSLENQPGPVSAPNPLPAHSNATSVNTQYKHVTRSSSNVQKQQHLANLIILDGSPRPMRVCIHLMFWWHVNLCNKQEKYNIIKQSKM